MTTEERKSDL